MRFLGPQSILDKYTAGDSRANRWQAIALMRSMALHQKGGELVRTMNVFDAIGALLTL